ncbi:hypothetical protein DACRYDRAFT_109379 [Dacryopinax primogenitus]|uniref:RRM domain-containing protein n=1 Tax=Dacryopinax primogenitus (strain DJM 731) TaxID=1858805 RepID=M5G237_DACPD|nr:uncharacterized protein DACRYDRAFT_109379 [Dacryopinax primogenitus]EJT99951.1 hypothetical protein DACRYDRAFT_109379 [Dacryopinax primogenitus]
MAEDKKLTKKQRKSLAFRQGKRQKTKPSEEDLRDLPEAEALNDVPVDEDADAEPQVIRFAQQETGKKRKRGEENGEGKGTKKRKGDDGAAVAGEKEPKGKDGEGKKAQAQKKKRYLLFVGNLPKDVTDHQLAAHFSSLPTTPTIRLRRPPGTPNTPNAASNAKSQPKSRPKIFAFLEFSDSASLQAALKLHRSNLGGKMINVELTVGGGGSGEKRKRRLEDKRKNAAEKLREYAKQGAEEAKGINKEWKKEHREKKAKDGKGRQGETGRPKRPVASGVNAIPVG